MLTPGELATMEAALAELLRSAEAVEAQYRKSRNWLWWLLPDDTTRRAQAAAEDRRRTYDEARRRRDELFELPDVDHEAVLAFLEGTRRIARDGLAVQLAAELATSARAPAALAAVEGAARDVVGAAAESAGGFRAAAKLLPILLGVVVLVAIVSAAAPALRALRRRG